MFVNTSISNVPIKRVKIFQFIMLKEFLKRGRTRSRLPLFGEGLICRMWQSSGYRSTDCIGGTTAPDLKEGPWARNIGFMLRSLLSYPWEPFIGDC